MGSSLPLASVPELSWSPPMTSGFQPIKTMPPILNQSGLGSVNSVSGAPIAIPPNDHNKEKMIF